MAMSANLGGQGSPEPKEQGNSGDQGSQGNQEPPNPSPPPNDDTESLRAQLKNSQAELKKLQDADKARADAALSETDRLKKQATEAEDRAKAAELAADQVRARSQFDRAAEKLGCKDVDMAWSAIGSGLQLQDGKLAGLDKALASLASSKPFLFGAGGEASPTGEGNNGGHNGPGKKTLTEADVRRMGKSNFAELRNKVRTGQIRLG